MKKSPRASAKKRLDAVFSRWIRLKDADSTGMVTCVTCGKRLHWKQAQAGHYVPRNNMSTRWLPENVHVQDVGCNLFGRGKPDEMAIYIMRKYGAQELERLNAMKHTITKFHAYDLNAMIAYYESELLKLHQPT